MKYAGPMPGVGNLITANPVLWYNQSLSVAGKFDIQNIPAFGSHFRAILSARSDVVATFDGVNGFFNNDSTAANYLRGFHQSGNTHASGQGTSISFGTAPGASSPASTFGILDIFVWNYASANTKNCRVNISHRVSATAMSSDYFTFNWGNTAAITRITLQTDNDPTDQFIAGSRLQIWLYR